MKPKKVKLTIKVFKTWADYRLQIFSDYNIDALYLGNGVYLHKSVDIGPIFLPGWWALSVDCGLMILIVKGLKEEALRIGKLLTELDWAGIEKPAPKEYKELAEKIAKNNSACIF